MHEVLTTWTGPGAATKLTVMYFDEAALIADVRLDLESFWSEIDSQMTDDTDWTIATSGRQIDDVTGGLTGAWSDAVSRTGGSASVGNTVPDAAQALVRWETGVIHDGRFLNGRTYLPGITNSAVFDGNLTPAANSALTTAIATFLGLNPGLLVWHRPIPDKGAGFPDPRPGASELVTSGSIWNEFAVQRRRRG